MPSNTFFQTSLVKKKIFRKGTELRFTTFYDKHAFSWYHRKNDPKNIWEYWEP